MVFIGPCPTLAEKDGMTGVEFSDSITGSEYILVPQFESQSEEFLKYKMSCVLTARKIHKCLQSWPGVPLPLSRGRLTLLHDLSSVSMGLK